MRISDWSSDVCSSDLALCLVPQGGALTDGTISMGAGLAELVKVPAAQAYAVGTADIAHASMGEPLACVAPSLRPSAFPAGDRVALIGRGYRARPHPVTVPHPAAARSENTRVGQECGT